MKLLPVLLGASLVANAALLVAHRSGGGHEKDGGTRSRANAAAEAAPRFTAPAGAATGEGKAITAAIRAGNMEALRDELRAAGLDEETVRSVVSARLWRTYAARIRAVQPAADPNRPWWKNDDDTGPSKEQREQVRLLREERKTELERLLGKDPGDTDPNSRLAREYGFVSAERREELQRLEQDYNDLSGDLRREARGFMLPSDQEKLKFLEEEKRRDLASVLTPEELADYDLRQSRTAQNLRWRMTQMDASEAEFRTIFELQKDFDERFSEFDQFGNRTRTMSQADWKARNDAENAMRGQLREALGADRYAAYVRAQDRDYQQLSNAAKRLDLPAGTTDRIYALRDEMPGRASKIADNTALTPDQKRDALKKLAAETRDRVRGALGAEAADAYFANNGMQWVKQLENGTITTFDVDGRQSQRRVEPPPKPAAPKK